MNRLQKGRTQPGRLDALDFFLAGPSLDLARPGPFHALDVGIGTRPDTTLALFDTLRSLHPAPELLAIDNAPARVDAAQPLARGGLRFLHADLFENPPPGPFHLVRAVNVLRSFVPERSIAGRQRLFALCEQGGVLLEGSTDSAGGTGAVFVATRAPTPQVSMLLFTDGRRGLAPRMFRGVLPQDVARGGKKTLIEQLFARWNRLLIDLRGRDVKNPDDGTGAPSTTLMAESVKRLALTMPHVAYVELGGGFGGLHFTDPDLRFLAFLA